MTTGLTRLLNSGPVRPIFVQKKPVSISVTMTPIFRMIGAIAMP